MKAFIHDNCEHRLSSPWVSLTNAHPLGTCLVMKVNHPSRFFVIRLYLLSIAMKKMAASNVLIVGLQGLGVEIGTLLTTSVTVNPCLSSSIAKNICLAGVKSVTIFDPEPVTIQDLSSQVRLFPRRVELT